LFSLHVLQKIKAMSIRKILGANAFHLIQTISQQYSIIALIALAFSIPLAWWLVKHWLKGFSYQVQLGPTIYLLSGIIILLTSFLVMTYHIFKVLTINPADTLKQE